MSSVTLKDVSVGLPEGYVAVPISDEQLSSPVQVCVVFRREPDPVAGHFVVLRDTIDARVLLGVIGDVESQVHQWVELWVQDLDGLTKAVPACLENLSNEVLDRRWSTHATALDQLKHPSLIKTGWEQVHPRPLFIDRTALEPVHPVDAETGHAWSLCQDDQLLRSKGLPIYGTTLHRYLYLAPLGEESPFIPVTAESPTNDCVKPLSYLTGRRQQLLGLNPGAGLMMVRPYSPIGYETFVDVLSGGSWDGMMHGRSVIEVGSVTSVLSGEADRQDKGDVSGRLFMGHHGRWGRLIEAYHLKLRLLADAIRAVRVVVATTQKPVHNLLPESFQIRLGEPGCAMPFLWTANASLVDPGDAVALPIQTSDADYYLPGSLTKASIYRPESANQPVEGRGRLRIRQILDTGGATIIEGTFTTQDRIDPARYDVAWFRLNLNNGRADLYARLERESALAQGEWRFRTVAQRLGEAAMEGLRSAEGVPIPDVHFQIVPLLSTPYDMYALAVLAVRTLLVDHETRLSIALDEVLSLAKQICVHWDGSASLATQIQGIFDEDQRWVDSLGPHRLTHEEISPEEAFDLVPMEVWWDTLALIVRMFPAVTPDSYSQDYGDAQPGGVHKVFDPVLEDVGALVLRTRSLILIDWRFNREVHAVIRRHRTGMAQS